MKLKYFLAMTVLAITSGNAVANGHININMQNSTIQNAPNGIELPKGYQDWPVISISHRTDNNSMRVIVGNDIAIKASRKGQTKPWPEGSILGKVVWKQTTEKHWATAIAPGKYVHAEFMIKDSEKYKSNGTGWGWARWTGLDQKPFGNDKNFDQACIACHIPVKNEDWVFTVPAKLP